MDPFLERLFDRAAGVFQIASHLLGRLQALHTVHNLVESGQGGIEFEPLGLQLPQAFHQVYLVLNSSAI